MKTKILLISLAGLGIAGFLSAGELTKAKEGGIKSLNTYAAKMLKEKSMMMQSMPILLFWKRKKVKVPFKIPFMHPQRQKRQTGISEAL